MFATGIIFGKIEIGNDCKIERMCGVMGSVNGSMVWEGCYVDCVSNDLST